MDERPIGVFDSGLGGLTAMRVLRRLLPEEDIIYFGDTARVPYGTRSAATVTKFALQDANFLLRQGVKLIVVACGTVSSIAMEELRRQCPVPVLGIVEPVAQAAVASSRSRRIGPFRPADLQFFHRASPLPAAELRHLRRPGPGQGTVRQLLLRLGLPHVIRQ